MKNQALISARASVSVLRSLIAQIGNPTGRDHASIQKRGEAAGYETAAQIVSRQTLQTVLALSDGEMRKIWHYSWVAREWFDTLPDDVLHPTAMRRAALELHLAKVMESPGWSWHDTEVAEVLGFDPKECAAEYIRRRNERDFHAMLGYLSPEDSAFGNAFDNVCQREGLPSLEQEVDRDFAGHVYITVTVPVEWPIHLLPPEVLKCKRSAREGKITFYSPSYTTLKLPTSRKVG